MNKERIKQAMGPDWKTDLIELKDNVFAYIQAGGTTAISNAGFIVGEKYVTLIDALSVQLGPELYRLVRTVTDKPVKYILLSHAHPDHFGGCYLYPDAVTICQTGCYKALQTLRQEALDREHKETGGKFPHPFGSKHIDLSSIVTFDNSMTMYVDNRKIQLMYYGYAHTNHDIVVYLPGDGIVFLEDLFMNYLPPGGTVCSLGDWANVLDKVLELDAEYFVSGHGAIGDRKAVQKCRDYMNLVYTEAKKAFETGIPYKEAARKIPLGEFRQWGSSERILMNVYRLYEIFRGEFIVPERPGLLRAELKEFKESGW